MSKVRRGANLHIRQTESLWDAPVIEKKGGHNKGTYTGLLCPLIQDTSSRAVNVNCLPPMMLAVLLLWDHIICGKWFMLVMHFFPPRDFVEDRLYYQGQTQLDSINLSNVNHY
jgi:hypothetical protein